MKVCKYCGLTGHSSMGCFKRPNKPLKGKKRIKRIGKVGRQWWQTRQDWIKKNLPDSGTWKCTYCGGELTMNILTLDHKLSRSRRPDLRYDLDNLVPACWECNTAKGSLSFEEYIEKISTT